MARRIIIRGGLTNRLRRLGSLRVNRRRMRGNRYEAQAWGRNLRTGAEALDNRARRRKILRDMERRGPQSSASRTGVFLDMDIDGLAGLLGHGDTRAFLKSSEYTRALRKIGEKWIKWARKNLRKTKSSRTLPMSKHLSRSLYYGVEPRATTVGKLTAPEDQVYINVKRGTPAARYFLQREYGGSSRMNKNRIAIPAMGGKYFEQVSRYRRGRNHKSVSEIFDLLSIRRSFTAKSDNPEKPWVIFGAKGPETKAKLEPIFVLKSMIEQERYPGGRFVNPAKRKLKSSGFARQQILEAWRAWAAGRAQDARAGRK